MSLLALLAACSYDPTVGTLPDNVGAAFAPCQESEIRFLSTKHNLQSVFEPCGNNNFGAFSWSPDGTRVYFQLGQTGYVMDAEAENKQTTTVPTPSPIGGAAWLNANQLALPVGPAEEEGSNRVAVFDLSQKSVYYRDLPFAGAPDIHRSNTAGFAWLVVNDGEGTPNRLKQMDLADGALTDALPWLPAGFDTFTATPKANTVMVGIADTVTRHDLDGKVLATYTPATRGTVHPDGRWLALEHEGDPISIFYQRAWDEMTEAQRKREAKRAQRLSSGLPESYPTTVDPPTLSFVDLQDGARWRMTSVYGSEFQWYEPSPYYGSFILWGFEGKQFRRNVMLGQMGDRLRATEIGRKFTGIEPMNPAAEARAPSPNPKPASRQ